MDLMVTFAIAYLLGSIPFGLLLTRMFGIGDIRQVGSGNIGATNVLRTGKKGLAIATLLLDLLKGIVAVKLIQHIYNYDMAMLAGLFVVLGHIFPIWLRFRGGKGVATTLGAFIALNWLLGIVVCAIWIAIFFITRISSLSAITSICCAPIAAYFFGDKLLALLCLIIAAIIIFTHRQNLKRLLTGTEPAFKSKEKI
jgi:glycerol-3-phosphate acyltransferase PlsY